MALLRRLVLSADNGLSFVFVSTALIVLSTDSFVELRMVLVDICLSTIWLDLVFVLLSSILSLDLSGFAVDEEGCDLTLSDAGNIGGLSGDGGGTDDVGDDATDEIDEGDDDAPFVGFDGFDFFVSARVT